MDRIAIGCDHGGLSLKNEITGYLDSKGIGYVDLGCYDGTSVDYPVYADAVCREITEGRASSGILVCGTGLGMCIAANKHRGIRAACCTDSYCAKMCRAHNNANVLCLGGRVTGAALAFEIVDAFVSTQFEGGRHQRRVDMLNALDGDAGKNV